jgi:transposase
VLSTCYRRFVEWQEAGVFHKMHVEMLLFYDQKRGIGWTWSSLDSAIVKAPKGGTRPGPTPPTEPRAAQNAMF